MFESILGLGLGMYQTGYNAALMDAIQKLKVTIKQHQQESPARWQRINNVQKQIDQYERMRDLDKRKPPPKK